MGGKVRGESNCWAGGEDLDLGSCFSGLFDFHLLAFGMADTEEVPRPCGFLVAAVECQPAGGRDEEEE